MGEDNKEIPEERKEMKRLCGCVLNKRTQEECTNSETEDGKEILETVATEDEENAKGDQIPENNKKGENDGITQEVEQEIPEVTDGKEVEDTKNEETVPVKEKDDNTGKKIDD